MVSEEPISILEKKKKKKKKEKPYKFLSPDWMEQWESTN